MLVLMICCGQFVSADVFLHNPRGSNNRLDEQNRCVPYHSAIFFSGFLRGFVQVCACSCERVGVWYGLTTGMHVGTQEPTKLKPVV